MVFWLVSWFVFVYALQVDGVAGLQYLDVEDIDLPLQFVCLYAGGVSELVLQVVDALLQGCYLFGNSVSQCRLGADVRFAHDGGWVFLAHVFLFCRFVAVVVCPLIGKVVGTVFHKVES